MNKKKPNLIIVGAQKCGTTWLYRALNLSPQIYGPKIKELHYWDRVNLTGFDSYQEHFLEAPDNVKYIFESTPGYFRLPNDEFNVAQRIYNKLGDIPLIVILRDPVERYLSAYTHHMIRGRLPVVETIEVLTEKYHLLEFGLYSDIYKNYRKYFSDIHIFFYDDLKKDYRALLRDVFSKLDLDIDFNINNADFQANDKVGNVEKLAKKTNKDNIKINKLPVLSESLVDELKTYYRQSICELETIVSRDLKEWY